MNDPAPKTLTTGVGAGDRQPDPAPEDAGSGALGGAIADLAFRALGLCEPVYIAGPDGVITYANDAYRQVFHRSDGTPARRLAPRLLATLKRTDGIVRQKTTAAVDGRERTFSGRHTRIGNDNGETTAFVGVYDDQTLETELRTALRLTKERSDELLSTVADWVWQTDADWTIVHSVTRDVTVEGSGCEGILGLSLLDAGQFEPGSGRRPPSPRTRAPFRDVPFRLANADGTERIYLLSGIPVFDPESGRFNGFRGSGTDVTDRLAAEQRALSYRRELEQALADLTATNTRLDGALSKAQEGDQAKSLFLGMIGHELRTPLNAVIGFSEIMSNELFGPLGNPEYKDYAGDILQSGQHLLSIINDILDVVKLEAGEMVLHPTRFDPVRAIDASSRLLILQAESKQIDIIRKVPDDLPPLLADEQKVRQMILNLLSNAIKFTQPGGAVTVSASLSDDGELMLSVADTGIGIDASLLDTILLPFKQADDRLSRNFEGTGLGLPLTRSLIELHGGRLEIESRKGDGTTVRLFFPAASVSAPSGSG